MSAYILVGSIDVGVALCAISGFLAFKKSRKWKKVVYPKGYASFLLYILFAAITVTHAIPLRILLYSLLLVIGMMCCNIYLIYKYYKKIAVICIVFFIFQEIIRLSTGINLPGIISVLPIVYGDSSSYIEANIINADRSSSFFLEPSYFAQFLFPLVVIELFWNKSKSHFRNALLLSVIIFLIRSGNGILLIGIIWAIWLFASDVKKSTKRLIVLFIAVFGIALIVFVPEILLEFLERSNELSINGVDERFQTSGFIRFFRGYYLYFSLPSINQIFGLNPELLDFYKLNNDLGLFDNDKSFINGVQTILCLYGVLGLLFFFRHLYFEGKHSPMICKVLLICTLFLLFSESFFISSRMLVTMVIVCSINHHHRRRISHPKQIKNNKITNTINYENSVSNEFIPGRK